MRKKLLDRTTG